MARATKDRLADALADANLPQLAERARAGEFDDYESRHPMPKHVLVQALHNWGRRDLALRVIEGDFDSSPEEGAAWLASREGERVKRRFGR